MEYELQIHNTFHDNFVCSLNSYLKKSGSENNFALLVIRTKTEFIEHFKVQYILSQLLFDCTIVHV